MSRWAATSRIGHSPRARPASAARARRELPFRPSARLPRRRAGNDAELCRWPSRRRATERHYRPRASRMERDMPDDTLVRLGYPGAQSIRHAVKGAQVVGTARRVLVDGVDRAREVFARIEIALPPGPPHHGASPLARTRGRGANPGITGRVPVDGPSRRRRERSAGRPPGAPSAGCRRLRRSAAHGAVGAVTGEGGRRPATVPEGVDQTRL